MASLMQKFETSKVPGTPGLGLKLKVKSCLKDLKAHTSIPTLGSLKTNGGWIPAKTPSF